MDTDLGIVRWVNLKRILNALCQHEIYAIKKIALKVAKWPF